MNIGTRLRGIALILALVLTGFALFDIMMVFSAKIVIYIFLVLAAAVGYYYNEDFSEAACHGTGVTRQIKREENQNYIGERFYTESINNKEPEDMEVANE